MIKLCILHTGQFFGHEDILEDTPFRTNSAYVKMSGTELYRIEKTDFFKLLSGFPYVKQILEDNKINKQKWRMRFKIDV